MDELKPCPFCGCGNAKRESGEYRGEYSVECPDCRSRGPVASLNVSEAAWNRRRPAQSEPVDVHSDNYLAGARLIAERWQQSWARKRNTPEPQQISQELFGELCADFQLLAETVAKRYAAPPASKEPPTPPQGGLTCPCKPESALAHCNLNCPCYNPAMSGVCYCCTPASNPLGDVVATKGLPYRTGPSPTPPAPEPAQSAQGGVAILTAEMARALLRGDNTFEDAEALRAIATGRTEVVVKASQT